MDFSSGQKRPKHLPRQTLPAAKTWTACWAPIALSAESSSIRYPPAFENRATATETTADSIRTTRTLKSRRRLLPDNNNSNNNNNNIAKLNRIGVRLLSSHEKVLSFTPANPWSRCRASKSRPTETWLISSSVWPIGPKPSWRSWCTSRRRSTGTPTWRKKRLRSWFGSCRQKNGKAWFNFFILALNGIQLFLSL